MNIKEADMKEEEKVTPEAVRIIAEKKKEEAPLQEVEIFRVKVTTREDPIRIISERIQKKEKGEDNF